MSHRLRANNLEKRSSDLDGNRTGNSVQWRKGRITQSAGRNLRTGGPHAACVLDTPAPVLDDLRVGVLRPSYKVRFLAPQTKGCKTIASGFRPPGIQPPSLPPVMGGGVYSTPLSPSLFIKLGRISPLMR
ncbi:hypothetical protein TNCV_1109651 [Trichonephila clavipes]|nr:hypothetical protein TNCV_1109651 [Trichonephila clavipes]